MHFMTTGFSPIILVHFFFIISMEVINYTMRTIKRLNYGLEKRFYNKAPVKPQRTFCLGHLYTERILVSGEHNIGHPG